MKDKNMIIISLLVSIVLILGGGPAWAVSAGSRWGAGYFPNISLVTQDGKTVRFYDDLIKDKVVAINFIFTHCSDSCPAETASMRQVQKELGDRAGRDVFFYSISIDPEHDTPAVLKEYSQRFRVGPGWTFLTGSKADITLLRKKLGLYNKDESEQVTSNHSISLIVGNEATGKWIKRSPFDEPKTLVRLLGYSLQQHAYRTNPGAMRYDKAPRLPELSRGEDLYRSRCDSCHSLGAEGGLGPGLSGVTEKREHAWLARWLKEPDQMLAEKDSVAMQLFDKYNEVPMPNLKLSDADVEALIAYMAGSAGHAEDVMTTNGEGGAGH
ncbi:SCO family protein [Methylobacter sp. Wu1]|uniref:SCO family protein n=1 Tax=Methylobacter sp. Wu1 TaxID=3119359 RepID=UPI002F925214